MVVKKTLVVVESPAKAKTIAKYLGNDYVVQPTVGHIVDLAKSKNDKLGVDIDNGFKPKYAVIPDKKDKVAAIIDAAKMSKEILIASDLDREGEAIAWHVADLVKDLNKPIARVLFKEITKKSIQTAISNPGELDKDLFDAQQARRVLDRLVGFLVSPYLWHSYGANCSAGRVQSVCLRLIVDREREILNFKPETYWTITTALAKLNKKSDSFIARYPTKITKEDLAYKIKKDLDESTYIVSNVEEKPMARNPYPPLITSKLQQLASGRFKFSASSTMKSAQALYEQGFVSYIRTDSTRSSPESIQAVRSWLHQNNYDVPSIPNSYKTKGTAQDAHEAIRPTDINLTPQEFTGSVEQKKIYQLIWERFVASQMKPAIYDTVAITIKASKGHELKANGRTLKYAGWLAITQDVDKKDEDDITLPLLKVGDDLILIPPKVKADKKETQPPPRYTEGSLIKELEKKGIGRPSTYAAIISKISDRNYVIKTKNVFTPTDLGCRVVDDLSKFFAFMNYEYTRDMEEQLDKIEIGKLKYVDMLQAFFDPFKAELKTARDAQDKDGGHDCDQCGKRMKLKHSKYGFFIACSGYPDCKNIKGVELQGEKIIIRERHTAVPGIKCPQCDAGMFRRDGKFGPFYSCEHWPSCKGTKKIPFGIKCKKCGNDLFMTIFKDTLKLACMGYPNCKNVEDVPPGTNINWVSPKKLNRKKSDKKYQKVISK